MHQREFYDAVQMSKVSVAVKVISDTPEQVDRQEQIVEWFDADGQIALTNPHKKMKQSCNVSR